MQRPLAYFATFRSHYTKFYGTVYEYLASICRFCVYLSNNIHHTYRSISALGKVWRTKIRYTVLQTYDSERMKQTSLTNKINKIRSSSESKNCTKYSDM